MRWLLHEALFTNRLDGMTAVIAARGGAIVEGVAQAVVDEMAE